MQKHLARPSAHKKNGSILRKAKTGHAGPLKNHAMLRGFHAWGEVSSGLEKRAIENMGFNGPAPAKFAELHAWWAMALTTDPVFLNEEARANCQMLIGFSPIHTPPPSWPAVAARACALYDQKTKGRGCDSELFLDSYDERQEFCSGRGVLFTPGFSMPPNFFDNLQSFSTIFDRRRALRRRGSAPPPSWERDFGARALDLWLGGLSRKAGLPMLDGSWIYALQSLMEAMAEAGAVHVQIYPRFFAIFPRAMDHFPIMERIDREACDPLRSSWLIAANAGSGLQDGALRRRL